MRIIAGRHRGLSLAPVGKGDPAAALRPTPDRVRESLFNILCGGAFGDAVTGAQVLDFFAGTGALGLEALSRGAAHATFVETGRAALTLLGKNLDRTREGDHATILRFDALRLPPNSGAPATLVFADPPYGKGLGPRAIAAAADGGWIAEGAVVVLEDRADTAVPALPGFTSRDSRIYGDTRLDFLIRSSG